MFFLLHLKLLFERVGVNNSAAKYRLSLFVYLVKDIKSYLESVKDFGQGFSFDLHAEYPS